VRSNRWYCSNFFLQAEDGIRDFHVTGVQTCALPICLDALASADTVVFDKTGTLTLGQPQLRGVQCFGAEGREAVLALAASLELRSEERRVGKECRYRCAPLH